MARVWLFGEDVDTDQIVPGRYAPYMTSEAELRLDTYELVTAHGIYALPAPPPFVREIWREGNLVQYYRRHGRFPGQTEER